jgi:hypothetical protein
MRLGSSPAPMSHALCFCELQRFYSLTKPKVSYESYMQGKQSCYLPGKRID